MELMQYHIPNANTTRQQDTLTTQFAILCQALTVSEPEMTEFACLCKKLCTLNNGDRLAVPDQESGQLLEHRRLHKDPRYKEVWDPSYAN
jgi:hypothetical protein